MIEDFGGIARSVPVLAVMFMIATLASIGLPGLNGFIGEFFILLGSYNSVLYGNITFAVLAATGVILAAVYMLWMYQRVMFGPLEKDENKAMLDLNMREVSLLIPLVVFMIWIGVRPVDFTIYSEGWTENYINTSEDKSVAVLRQTNFEDLPDWTAAIYYKEESEIESQFVTRD